MSESRTMPLIEETGLTQGEVIALRESGLDNAVKASTSRSLIDIVRANVFTLFNGIIFAAMVMVLITGSWRDAVFGMIIIINTGIGICTELKAKRTLDKLSILVASDYLVHRDGKDVEIPHNDIVLGDFMWIRSGEQVPADAQIVHTWGLELDESMLTGESRTVRKGEGCDIFSGSTAISGMALVKVTAVGEHSYAAKLTARAKVYRKTVSDLNKGINTILKFMTFLVVPLCVLLIWSQVRTVGGWNVAISTGEWRSAVISAVAGVVGMIPEGLVLLTSLNFALAAIRLARKNTLVQELESVETLARVDCLNLDKTGTVTDGTIRLDSLELLGVRGPDDMRGTVNEHDVRQALFDLSNEGQPNGTGQAILSGLREQGFADGTVEARVPFSSARKWSSIYDGNAVWTMGAPEVILSQINGDHADILKQVNDLANDGNRVLLVARIYGAAPDDYETDPKLNPASCPVALVCCSEHIRADAEETLAWFREQGVRCRIISGDNPVTVGAIARKVHLTGEHEPRFMDARELPADITELAQVLENVDVLGRVLPDQKKAIVEALHAGEHVVAMTGDGVNDALAIKEADLGIAMGNAAPATKAVAQVVLVDSKFLASARCGGARASGHGQYGTCGKPIPRENRVFRTDFVGCGADADTIPVSASPHHICGWIDDWHAGIHSCVGSEHASLYSRIPETRAAFCCALRCGGRIVDFVHVVAAADIHEVECAGFGCAVGDAAWRQRDYSAHDGSVRACAGGKAVAFVAWHIGIGLCRNWIRGHARKTGGEFLRAGGADRADAGCDGGGNGAFGTRVLGVFAFGAENSEYCPIL